MWLDRSNQELGTQLTPGKTKELKRDSVDASSIRSIGVADIQHDLQQMTTYRSLDLSAQSVRNAGLQLPDYSMSDYIGELKVTAQLQQIEMNIALTQMTATVCYLAEEMKNFVKRILQTLDANVASESIYIGSQDKSLSKLRHGAERGIVLITDIQQKVVALNREMTLLQKKAEGLRQGYSGMIERLENNFDLWTNACGMKKFSDFHSMHKNLQRDLLRMQDRIARTEKELRKLQSPNRGNKVVPETGLTRIVEFIPRGIKTSLLKRERTALLLNNRKLGQRAEVLEYGVKITRFVETALSLIDSMGGRVKNVQLKSKSINAEFGNILRQLAEIQSIANEETTASPAAPDDERLRMRKIYRLLENISDTAHFYREPSH